MLKKIAAAAALAIVASTAAAQSAAPAFYIGADVGQTKIDDFDDRETGYGIFAGYQLNQTFAIEANYRRLADFDDTEFGVNYNFKADQVGLSAVASLPLSDVFSLYGRLGYNRVSAKASAGGFTEKDNESGALYGVGLNFAITPTMAARVEVQKPHSDLTNVSAGISFKF